MMVRCNTKNSTPLVAGDGLCFVGDDGKLTGFRVNKVEGQTIFPASMPRVAKGMMLFRNFDFAFDKQLSRPTATRTLAAKITLRETDSGYVIDMSDESGNSVTKHFEAEHEVAKTSQREAISRQLSKLGNTVFRATQVEVHTNGERFIPASLLAEWRRAVCDTLMLAHRASYRRDEKGNPDYERLRKLLPKQLDYTANVSNHLAREFYEEAGVESIAPAFEVAPPQGGAVLMTCRHCLRFATSGSNAALLITTVHRSVHRMWRLSPMWRAPSTAVLRTIFCMAGPMLPFGLFIRPKQRDRQWEW